MNEKLRHHCIEKYDRQVPRYTSFPTTLQFNQNFNRNDVENIFEFLDADEPISIYVHIPFCHSLCHYCGCTTKITKSKDILSSYVDFLVQEIEHTAKMLPHKLTVERIHFGGGSPNYPDAESIKRALDTLEKNFTFLSGISIDMECDPRLLNAEKIEAYVRMGINRISLGIQDFDEDVQKAINRIQLFEDVEKCVQSFREKGIKSINFDIIVGLPLQSAQSIENTLDKIVALKPDRISVFPYAHVPWMKKHQQVLEHYPRPEALEKFDLIEQIREKLVSCGYQPIGIDHYALPTDSLYTNYQNRNIRRNFQGYTDDTAENIIGFGASSISKIKGNYLQNCIDIRVYQGLVADRKIPIQKICAISDEDIERAKVIEGIMCYFEADEKLFTSLLVNKEVFFSLQEDNFINLEDGVLRITAKGKPFTRVVASCIDPYLYKIEGEKRHARSI